MIVKKNEKEKWQNENEANMRVKRIYRNRYGWFGV